MKLAKDIRAIEAMGPAQRGVFSKGDLQTLLGEKHPSAFVRRVRALQDQDVLKRFVRGWYVLPASFDLATLSQRLGPDSYISLGTALAKQLIVGTTAERKISAIKRGRSRKYEGLGYTILHLGVAEHLLFGFDTKAGVRWATPEKAFLDTLYFHLRGRRYRFDVYSDLNLSALNRQRLTDYLGVYRNPKFVSFVQGVLDESE